MSDTIKSADTLPVTLATKSFDFGEIILPGRKTKNNPTPSDERYLAPVLDSHDARGAFVVALLEQADSVKEGTGDQIWDKLTQKFFRSVSDVVYTADGVVHPEKIVPALVAVRHSSGITSDQLEELSAALNTEMLTLMPLVLKQANDPEGFAAELRERGWSEDDFAVHMLNIQGRLQDVADKRAKMEAARAERNKKRAENAKKAEAEAVAA
jgi:hypothetical protein